MLLNKCEHYDARVWETFEATGLPGRAFLEEGPSLWAKLGINEKNSSVIMKALSSGWADRDVELCEQFGARIITCRDAEFPKPLLRISNPPLLLYARGKTAFPDENSIAVVGTRGCSIYASKVAAELGRRAATRGRTVISGGAKGVDGASHLGCLDGGGMTAAVLGTGVDVVYPAEHRGLFERIMERGALYSEYPFGARGEYWHFPRRNRIIVGMASRVVVVEAPRKSGAMITARLAGEEGREVWAAPGRMDDERATGSNRLIFDGAMPLIDFDIFFDENSDRMRGTLFDDEEIRRAEEKKPQTVTEDERKILSLLAVHVDDTIDNLAGEAKMSAAEVFKIITLLSLRGLVFSSGPGRYRMTD
jgi:DNA processing protein